KVTLTLVRNDDPLDEVGETPTEEEVAEVIEKEQPPEPEKPQPPVVDEEPVVPPAPEEPVAETPSEPEPEVALVEPEPEAEPEPEPEPTVYEEIIVMDKPQAREAFNQLSGSWAASVQSQLMEDS